MTALKHKLLGSIILSVGKYKNRVKGALRDVDSKGIRLDCHHMPHDGTTLVPREEGTALAIPEDLHVKLHTKRYKKVPKEDLHTQVENDFDFIRTGLRQRGYPDDMIDEARWLVHERNRNMHFYSNPEGRIIVVNLYDDPVFKKGITR